MQPERCDFHVTRSPVSDGKLELGAGSTAPQPKEVTRRKGGHVSTNNQPADTAGNEKRNHRPKRVSARTAGSGAGSRVRVRTKRLDQVDDEKIALAYWLLAKQIVEKGDDDEADGPPAAGVRK